MIEKIKRFITEWNLIMVVYLILMGMIGAQMLYIYRIKGELKIFQDKTTNHEQVETDRN
jgi:hypothetical protein